MLSDSHPLVISSAPTRLNRPPNSNKTSASSIDDVQTEFGALLPPASQAKNERAPLPHIHQAHQQPASDAAPQTQDRALGSPSRPQGARPRVGDMVFKVSASLLIGMIGVLFGAIMAELMGRLA